MRNEVSPKAICVFALAVLYLILIRSAPAYCEVPVDFFDQIAEEKIWEGFPVIWIASYSDPLTGYDVNCDKNTRFKGMGLPLRKIEKQDSVSYLYFLSGAFLLQNLQGDWVYLYRLWAFLNLSEDGRILKIAAEEGPFRYLGYNPSPYDSGYQFMMVEGNHHPPTGHSGSIWIDGYYQEIPTPEVVYEVSAYHLEGGDTVSFSGVALEPVQMGGMDYHLTGGIIEQTSSKIRPHRIFGTLEYDGSYHLYLESDYIDYWGRYIGQYYGEGEYWDVLVVEEISPQCLRRGELEGQVRPISSSVHPNPFNVSTTISYRLPVNREVKLEVYNLLGQRVTTLVNEKQQAGDKFVIWDAYQVSSGLYFYKLTAGEKTSTRMMALIK